MRVKASVLIAVALGLCALVYLHQLSSASRRLEQQLQSDVRRQHGLQLAPFKLVPAGGQPVRLDRRSLEPEQIDMPLPEPWDPRMPQVRYRRY